MEEAMIVSDSNTTMESDMKGEYSSDTNNESEVENDDIEITFGPWPPFPSKQDTEVSEDQIQMTINSEDSSQPSMLYEQESVGSEISLDDHIDLESVEDFIKTDGIISQCVQTDETETADVSGQHEVLTSNKAYTMKDRLNDPEFTTDDEGKIPTDDGAVTDSSVHSGSDIIADISEQTANLASLHTEYDDVTSKCVPSDSDSRSANSDCDVDSSSSIHINEHTKKMIIPPTECGDVIKKYVPSESGMSLNVNESVISDVINEQSQITPDILVKDEPVTDGYPDSTQMVIAQDDNLFVSTEHGKMFMRSVAAEPLENEGNEFEESKMDNLTDKVQTDRNEVYRLEPGKELLNKNLRRGCREKARVPGGEADIRKGHEHIHGRIINQDSVLGRKTRVVTEPRDHEDTNLDKQVLVPGTKRGKFKKRSRKFALSSPKKRKKLEEGSEKLISKCRVVSHSQCSSPVSSEVDNDMRPEDQVSYNISSSSAVNAVGSLTSHEQVDLSLVKTEPIESTDQDQGNAGIKLMETEATSWIKKEPDENNLMESSIETTIPVPVKLIRNEVINSGTPRPGMGTVILTNSHQQVGSTTKILKSVTTDMVEGPSINLERGQKIWYAVPKGDHSTIPISGTGSSDQRIVKVIKLDSVKNAPQTLLLPGNLKLCKLQKTPNMALCEGKEIPLSSVPSHRHTLADDTYTSDNEEDHEQKNLSSILNHKNEMLADNTCTFDQEEDQDEKNLMLKKIDSIIEKNLELMKKNQLPTMRKRGSNLTQKLFPSQNQVMGPHWCEKIDEETGKTTMVLMPTTGEEMTTKKTLPRIIYRSKNSGSKKKQKTDKWKKKIPVDEQIDGIIRKNLEMLKKIQLPEKIQSQPPQIDEKNENTDMVVVKNIVGEEKDGKPLNTVIYRFISSRRQSKQNITDTSCSKTPTPASPSLQLPDVALQAKETPVHNKPLMCNSFTQTKGDRSNVKKHETGIAVMVRDASTQSNTNLEKPSSFIEDGSVDILENSVGLTSPDVKISSHTGDTDLLMDVEEVDLSNLENKAPKDPLTTLRPMWRWAGRQTVSVGVNTGEACKDVWESVNPVDNQYTFGPIKEKERRKAVYKTERVKQHRNLSTKGQKMQKLIKRRKFLKNKQWEYNHKVAKLRLKFEQKKATSSEVVNKNLSIENTVVSADMATKQTQQFGMKDSTNDNSVGKVEDTNLDSNEETTKTDSSENDKHAAVELGTRTSSRIKACQVKALDNADLSGFFEHVQKKLKDVEEVEDVKSTTYITDSSDEEWQQVITELSSLGTVSDVQDTPTYTSQSVSDSSVDQSGIQGVREVCISEEENMEVYLMCMQDTSLQEMDVYLMYTDDFDMDKYTEVIQSEHHDQAVSDGSWDEDVELEPQNDIEDIQQNIDENIFTENVNVDGNSCSGQSYLRHNKTLSINPLSPHQFDKMSRESHHSLKVKTMRALSLKPVSNIASTQASIEMSPSHKISPSLESSEVKEIERLKNNCKPLTVSLAVQERSHTLRQQEVKERSHTFRPQEVKEWSHTLRQQEVKERSHTWRHQEVKERLHTMRPQKVKERSNTFTPEEAKERSHTLEPQEAKESSHRLRPKEIKERSKGREVKKKSMQQQMAKERSYTRRRQEDSPRIQTTIQESQGTLPSSGQLCFLEISPTSRPLNVGEKSQVSGPVNVQVQEMSPKHRNQEVKETCNNFPSTQTPFQNIESTHMTEKCEEVNKVPYLGYGSEVVWDETADVKDADNVEKQKIDINNNNCTPIDSPTMFLTDCEYEYTTTDDYLYLDPLDLSMKPQNFSNPFPGNDQNRNNSGLLREQNPGYASGMLTDNDVCTNFAAESKFQKKLSRPTVGATRVSPSVRIQIHQDTTSIGSEVGVNAYSSRNHFQGQDDNSGRTYYANGRSRSCPEYKEFDMNSNHTGLDLNNNEPCLSNSDVICQLDVRSSCEDLKQHTSTNCIVPHAATTQSWYNDRYCDTSTNSEWPCLRWEGDISEKIHSCCPLLTRHTRQEKEGDALITHLEDRIQDKCRSVGDDDFLNSNCRKMGKNLLESEKHFASTNSLNESQEWRKFHDPFNSTMDRNTGPNAHERMLMHRMYAQSVLEDDTCKEDPYVEQRVFNRLHSNHPVDSMEMCLNPAGDALSQEDLPLDLTCNVNYTTPTRSIHGQPDLGNSVCKLRPEFQSSIFNIQPSYETENEMLNNGKFNPSFSMKQGVLTNLQLPDNIPELLCQRAIPQPGCLAYPPQHTTLSNPRPTGPTDTWRNSAAYQPVLDEVPRGFAERNVCTNPSASPKAVQLPACVFNSFGENNIQTTKDDINKNISRKRKSKTKKNYEVLSQILDSHNEMTSYNLPTTENCHVSSGKSGTSCTGYHVNPLPQTFPAMPHRHARLNTSKAYSSSLPANSSLWLPFQQPFYSDNTFRTKLSGLSDYSMSMPTHKDLFRPYMDPKKTQFNRDPIMTTDIGFQNLDSNRVGMLGKMKFPEGRNNDEGESFVRESYEEKKRFPFSGSQATWSNACVNKAGYPQCRDTGNIHQFRYPDGAGSQPRGLGGNWGQFLFKGNESNIFRCPNETGQVKYRNKGPALDGSINAAVFTQQGMMDMEMLHTAGRPEILQRTEKTGNMGKAHTRKSGYTETTSFEQTNLVDFADKSLAFAKGLSRRQSMNKSACQRNVECGNYCCKCWSRGKCRSCVCSKKGCYNCRNPLCCFKDMSPSCKKVRRQSKSQTRSRRLAGQHNGQQNGQDCSRDPNTGFVGWTCRLRGTSKQAEDNNDQIKGSVLLVTEQVGNLQASKISEQATKTSFWPEGVMDRKLNMMDANENFCVTEENLVAGSKGTYEPAHQTRQRNTIQALREKCEAGSMRKRNKSSLSNSIAEQRSEFTEQRPVRLTPNESSVMITVGEDLGSGQDKQNFNQGKENQRSSATFEHLEPQNEICGIFCGQKQSYRVPVSASGFMTYFTREQNDRDRRSKDFIEIENKSDKTSTNVNEGTSKKECGRKGKEKKTGSKDRKKVGSHQIQVQKCDLNNNAESTHRKTRKRFGSDDKKKDQIPDVMIAKIPKSSTNTEASVNLVDVNNNLNTTKGKDFPDVIDVNNNDLCCPKPCRTLINPKSQTDRTKMVNTLTNSPHQTMKKSKITKEMDKIGDVEVFQEPCVSGNIDNAPEIEPGMKIKQDSQTLPKKGRPRKKPLLKEKKCVPKVLIKLEDHTDKYEVTQFTSFHKKDRNIEVGLKSFERFTCRLCCGIYQYNTPDRTSMEDHLAQHLSGRLTCPDCGQTFSQAIHVQEHRQKTHRTAKFTCEICSKKFFTNTTLKRHLCKAHGHKLFNCKQCMEKYSSVDEVKAHVYQVHKGEATKCEKCGVISLSSKAAATHAKSKMCIARDESNVPCPHCNRILSVSQMAHHVKRIHLRVHTYKCDQCPYTTLARTALNNHVMMHQGVHPFQCELCPFSCVKSYQLSSHMRTHTGVKPYRCDKCSYAAAWNVQLKDHMRAHVSPHSILCKECGILFKDDRCLNLHNKKVHKSKEEVNVTKQGKVKDKRTRPRRLNKTMAVKDKTPADPNSDNTQRETWT